MKREMRTRTAKRRRRKTRRCMARQGAGHEGRIPTAGAARSRRPTRETAKRETRRSAGERAEEAPSSPPRSGDALTISGRRPTPPLTGPGRRRGVRTKGRMRTPESGPRGPRLPGPACPCTPVPGTAAAGNANVHPTRGSWRAAAAGHQPAASLLTAALPDGSPAPDPPVAGETRSEGDRGASSPEEAGPQEFHEEPPEEHPGGRTDQGEDGAEKRDEDRAEDEENEAEKINTRTVSSTTSPCSPPPAGSRSGGGRRTSQGKQAGKGRGR